VVLVAMLVAVGLAFAACGEDETSTTPSDEGTPKPGGTFSYGSTAEPGGIANWTVYESEGWNINHQLFEGLVQYELESDGTMSTQPCIADSWDSPDGKVWTFKIHQGVMFAPPVNREVKAQDVVDSWNFNSDPKLGTNYTVFVMAAVEGTDDSGFREGKAISGLKVIDDYTLEVTLKQPFFDFPTTLGHPIMYVEPVDYIYEVGVKKYAEKPEGGSGPFMIKEWKPERYIDLVANPDWWQSEAQGGGPYLDAIHMQRYQNENSEWLDFQTGTIDWTGVPPGQVAAAEAKPEVQDGTWSAKAWPELAVEYTNINMEEPTIGGDQGLKIRQALAYSADTDSIVNIVREGVPTVATGYVPVGIPGSGITKSPYTYDPEKAKQIVDELGGIPQLNYWTETGSETATKVAEALQAGWKAAGIDVKITAYEWNKLNDMQRSQAPGDQIGRSGWLADYPLMDDFLYPLFYSSQAGLNGYSFYKDPDFDALIDEARATSDEQQRLNLYAQAEKMILDDVVVIPTYWFRAFRVWNSTRVGGLVYTPMATIDLWDTWIKE